MPRERDSISHARDGIARDSQLYTIFNSGKIHCVQTSQPLNMVEFKHDTYHTSLVRPRNSAAWIEMDISCVRTHTHSFASACPYHIAPLVLQFTASRPRAFICFWNPSRIYLHNFPVAAHLCFTKIQFEGHFWYTARVGNHHTDHLHQLESHHDHLWVVFIGLWVHKVARWFSLFFSYKHHMSYPTWLWSIRSIYEFFWDLFVYLFA